MGLWLDLAIAGLITGGMYALVAVGLNLQYAVQPGQIAWFRRSPGKPFRMGYGNNHDRKDYMRIRNEYFVAKEVGQGRLQACRDQVLVLPVFSSFAEGSEPKALQANRQMRVKARARMPVRQADTTGNRRGSLATRGCWGAWARR